MMTLFCLFAFSETVLFERKGEVKTVHSSGNRQPTSVRNGNLPGYLLQKSNQIEAVSLVHKNSQEISNIFAEGGFYTITVLSDLYAYIGQKSEVFGLYNDGSRNITITGEAFLNPSKDSLSITFKSFYHANKKYDFIAKGLDLAKTSDLKAQYQSNEGKYFIGDLLSTSVAAYFDARVSRSPNIWGNQVEDNSVDNALKKGASAAFLESSDRFKEQIKENKPFGFIPANTILSMFVITKGGTK